MTADELRATLGGTEPPPGLSPTLAALWRAGRGEWDAAHALVQDEPGPEAAAVHAYLHRVEGDEGNAAYWYRRARRPAFAGPLDAEWVALATELGSRERS